MDKLKAKIQYSKFLIFAFTCAFLFFTFQLTCFAAQGDDLEFNLDVSSNTVPLPAIFKPAVDLSGSGFNRDPSWPQAVAAKEVLGIWQKDIGFSGMYRMQYNLWEINQLSKDKDARDKLLGNYENIIKNISDAGGTVILDIFGTPAGLGKVLDKKSPPWDLKAFKELVKNTIRDLSCNKRLNIWYEVWSAPDLDEFFLGRVQEYLNLYRAVAESIMELEAETKVHIPLGAPSVSWWFQNIDGNDNFTPEKSLIYELIKFCYHYRLPLNFITWHSFTTDPAAEKELTIYKKPYVTLLRDWLSYFNFDKNTLLIVDEWNYDRNANSAPERKEKSFITASYIPGRIKGMYEAGIDYQLYFCLEDFQNNKEGISRNVGAFSSNSPKAVYNAYRMLDNLGSDMFLTKMEDDFTGVIATKQEDKLILLVFNYIDPEIARNYLSRNIVILNNSERKLLLNLINSPKLENILQHKLDIYSLRLTKRVKAMLKKTQELNDLGQKLQSSSRNIKISIKNLGSLKGAESPDSKVAKSKDSADDAKEVYQYQRYAVDSSCSKDCKFTPVEEKEISSPEPYQEVLISNPYSVNLIILKKKPKEEQAAVSTPAPAVANTATASGAVPQEKSPAEEKK